MVVDANTGQKANFSSKNTILEVFKKDDKKNKINLNTNFNRFSSNNILKFY